MTLQDFRINHSKLIEQYQYIESRLEGIYSRICADTFMGGLKEVETDTIRRLINRITRYENETKTAILPQGIRQRLETIIEARNFYVHNCYWEMAVTRKNRVEVIKHDAVAHKLLNALRQAEELHEDLFNLFQKIDSSYPKQQFSDLLTF